MISTVAVRAMIALAAITSCTAVIGADDVRLDTIWSDSTWTELHRAFKESGKRADGVVAGAFAEAIVKLLGDESVSLETLYRLTQEDLQFRKFVKDAMGESMDQRSEAVVRFRLDRCTVSGCSSAAFCREVKSWLDVQ